MSKRPYLGDTSTVSGANAEPLGSKTQRLASGSPSSKDEEYFSKANFALSGALAKDTKTGTAVKSATTGEAIASKYSEPEDACEPVGNWRIFVFKGDDCLETLYLHRKAFFGIGREQELADILVAHPSCSKEHAVLQYRKRQGGTAALYVIDLDSTNGTWLNGERIVSAHYIELKDGDVLNFGQSSRDYVIKCGPVVGKKSVQKGH
jgi:smad nuclear-interacting protein 1